MRMNSLLHFPAPIFLPANAPWFESRPPVVVHRDGEETHFHDETHQTNYRFRRLRRRPVRSLCDCFHFLSGLLNSGGAEADVVVAEAGVGAYRSAHRTHRAMLRQRRPAAPARAALLGTYRIKHGVLVYCLGLSKHHSHTLPSMSYSPQGLGSFFATARLPALVVVLFVGPAGGIVAVFQLEIDAAVPCVPSNRIQGRAVALAQDFQRPGVGRRRRFRLGMHIPIGLRWAAQGPNRTADR